MLSDGLNIRCRIRAQRVQLRQRLKHGLERDLNLVIAKAVIAAMRSDTLAEGPANVRSSAGAEMQTRAALEPFAVGLEFGARNRQQGWAMGQTIHVAMMNLIPALEPEDAARASEIVAQLRSDDRSDRHVRLPFSSPRTPLVRRPPEYTSARLVRPLGWALERRSWW